MIIISLPPRIIMPRAFSLLILSAILLAANASKAQRLYVDASATGLKNGTSWSNAFTDLQSALTAASPGTHIWLANGVYKPTTSKKRSTTFLMKQGVSIWGGFAGTESSLEERNTNLHPTTLSGNIGNVSDSTDNSYHVVVINTLAGDTITLDGLIISGGAANKDSTNAKEGAGLQIINTNKVKISNCIIEKNVSYNEGGGVYLKNSSPLFVNCVVRNNANNARSIANGGGSCMGSEMGGAGVFNTIGTPHFRKCTFESNLPGYICSGYITHGSSFFSKTGGAVFSHCRFATNRATVLDLQWTSIVMGVDASISFADCTFDDNDPTPVRASGGILLVDNSSFTHGKAGAIRTSASKLIITGSSFQDNAAIEIVEAAYAAAGSAISTSHFINNNSEGALQLVESDIPIDLCRFENNQVGSAGNRDGGAIYSYRSSFTLTNSTFVNNRGGKGGAIFNEGNSGDVAKPIIRQCVFNKNYADEGTVVVGGADIHNGYFVDALVENSIFTGSLSGAAITNESGTATIVGCAISGSHRTGIYNVGSSPKVTNCTLSNNGFYDIYNYNGSPVIVNSIFNGLGIGTRSGTPTISYSLFPTVVAGTGNIQATNVLIDPDGGDNIVGTSDDDLRVKTSGAAIDAGSIVTTGLQLPQKDLAGNSRILNGRIDMGAYEYKAPKINQSISFAQLPNMVYGDAPITLIATASSGLAVEFSVFGPADLDGSELNITGAGTVSVTASQPGNDNFNASTVTRSFVVAKARQEIIFDAISDKQIDDQPFPLVAMASSGLPVEFSVSGSALLEGNQLTIVAAGTVSVTASQSGSNNFHAATIVTRTFNVEKIPQAITFAPIANTLLNADPFYPLATASSGLTVEFSVSGPAHLEDGQVILTAAGTVSVTASQPGNSRFSGATDVTQSFEVTKVPQEITFEPILNKAVGDEPFALVATASSGLAVLFEIISGPASVDGNMLTITGAGEITVEASQAGNDVFLPAASTQRFDAQIVLGVEEEASNSILVFPSPAEKWLEVAGINNLSDVSVLDAMGRKIIIPPADNGRLDVSMLSPGPYVVTVVWEKKKIYRKFIKK